MKSSKSILFALTSLLSINAFSNINNSTDCISEIEQNYTLRKNVELTGKWKLDIDFNQLFVKIYGENNFIKNNTDKTSEKLRLSIILVEDIPNSKDFSGYKIIDVDINPVNGNSEIKDTKIETNFLNRLPQGKYYPMLILSELDKDGIYKTKSTVKFTERYTI